ASYIPSPPLSKAFTRTVEITPGPTPKRPAPRDAARGLVSCLLDDGGDDAGADRAATLADGEAQLLLHGDRDDQLDLHRHVVARHHHLGALGQLHHPRHVRRAEVELRTVVVE